MKQYKTEAENSKDYLRIRMLTPLWTGDINNNCENVKDTGIIGSLRWWYEALVRGLGGYACDPTNSACQFNYKEYQKTGKIQDGLKDLCDVCYLFGCTGWSRRFLLIVENGDTIYRGTMKVNYNRNKGWYLKGGLSGTLDTRIMNTSENDYRDTVLSLLKFVSRWGGIGAKTQQGYGSFCQNPEEGELPETEFPRVLVSGNRKKNFEQRHLPHIEDIFVWKVRLEDFSLKSISKKGNFECGGISIDDMPQDTDPLDFLIKKYKFIPTSPLFRYRLRRCLRQSLGNDDLRHFLMGFMSTSNKPKLRMGRKSHKKMGSKIHVSHLYKNKNVFEMKIWTWIPKYVLINENGPVRLFEEHFRTKINDILKTLNKEIKQAAEEIFSVENLSINLWKFNPEQKKAEQITDSALFAGTTGE
jgi:CRISPR-associated protein Cmr1